MYIVCEKLKEDKKKREREKPKAKQGLPNEPLNIMVGFNDSTRSFLKRTRTETCGNDNQKGEMHRIHW